LTARRIFIAYSIKRNDNGEVNSNEASMTAFKLALVLHIIFGIIAFVAAPSAMMAKKGSPIHKRFGKLFFYAMMGVAASAFVLWTLGAKLFLMLIAIFSFYLAFSGYRAVKLKNNPAEEEDWLVAGSAFLAGLGLVGMGLYYKIQGDSFGIVSIVFGMVCAISAARDMLRFYRPATNPQAWLINHLSKMLGAYIATVSFCRQCGVGCGQPSSSVRWFLCGRESIGPDMRA
jgi:uncharacterized membrane protein